MSKRFYECDNNHTLNDTIAQLVGDNRYYIVVDRLVAQLHAAVLKPLLSQPNCLASYQLEAAESNKCLTTAATICDQLLACNAKRSDYVIAIGGGITSDVAAFSAAIVKRGLRLIVVPTTLLGMVDAAIGGKTGVNTAHGKNSLGCFYEAQFIIFERAFLSSLADEQWQNGRGECIKYSFLDQAFSLKKAMAPLDDFKTNAADNVVRYAAYKQTIVARDLYDVGSRKVLNFGHTFGHALESANQGAGLAHGKAVMLGIAIALVFSEKIFNIEQKLVDDYQNWLCQQTWYKHDYLRPFDELEYFIKRDKKNSRQLISLVLLDGIANPKIVDLSVAQVRNMYRGYRHASLHSAQ